MSHAPWPVLALLALAACGGAAAENTSGAGTGTPSAEAAPPPAPGPVLDTDPDRDDDRILDVEDRCPTEAENYNGFEDEDGCPDRGQVIIDDGTGHYGTYRALFRRNSARLPEDLAPFADAVAATLAGNPQTERAACIGRAGPRERDPRGLSLARAGAVCKSLVDRGVDPGRLVAFGAGAGDPLTAGEAFDPATERSVTMEILVVAGVEQNRWNGQSLEPVVPAHDGR